MASSERPPAAVSRTGTAGFFVSKKLALCLSFLFVGTVACAALVAYFAIPQPQGETISFHPAVRKQDEILTPYEFFDHRGVKAIDVRLPKSVRPVRYMIQLQPLINGNFTIFGYTEITIEVTEATTNVTLHLADIVTKNETIKLNSIDDLSGLGVGISEHVYDVEREFYIAQLSEELVAGQQYVLAMEFEGYLNDKLIGLYRSQYTKDDGTLTWLAATQFQPTDARRAFPCFDEPSFKAEFDVFIARQTNMTAIANMPRMETLPFDDDLEWVWDHFYTTLPMSTYLVAFIVSDFANINSTYNDHVLFRVWAREEAINQAEYAKEAGPAILTWYEDYFSIPFPLPKQDLMALPDFALGAMENWGLITFRETALLYDPELSSTSNKEGVATIVAHELAHQWFGDLVTMEWWSDLWLNEGFASYVEYLGTNSFEPTWNMLDQFVIKDLQDVFGVDSLESSHPISVPVGHPDEINQIFDGISYSKGASIIRMMNHFLTEATFRAGLTNYLNNHQYGNAAQDDLWAALTDQAHVDANLPEELTVKTIMDTWTLQMGYPVISVTLNGDGTATLTQERFLLVKSLNSTDTHDYKWWVPVTFTSQENPDFTQTQATEWIPDTEETMTISGMPAAGNWVIFNVQQTGYYRVNYEPSNWQLIVEQLLNDYTVVNLVNRAQIIDDALDLARSGQLSYDVALSVNAYLGNETEYVPWSAALDNMGYLEAMFTRAGGYGELKNYLLALLTPLYNSVGFEDDLDDSHLDQYKRVIALSWSCSLGLQDCVTNSVQLYAEWMANPDNLTIVSPNLKSTVYCTAIGEGGEEEWDFAWTQYLASNVGSEKNRLLHALGCSKEIWILSRYLEMGFTETSGIRKQDSSRVFESVAENDIGRDVAWNYLRENYGVISQYYQSFAAVGDLVESVSYEFNTREELKELIQFRDDHVNDLGGAAQAVAQGIERTSNNIAWMDNYYGVIVAWLLENGYGRKTKI